MKNHQNSDWNPLITSFENSPEGKKIKSFLKNQTEEIYPPKDKIYHAFELTPLSQVKVVILGQDPYHGEGQAHGLSFSVPEGTPIPPSLRNIFKELATGCDIQNPPHGDLTSWAKQGVLLLNTCLTVTKGKANSHKGQGWETLTDLAITEVNQAKNPTVFLLWGANAHKKESLITNPHHLILKTVHPSPLSAYRGFLGCQHFSLTNQFLAQHGREKINWNNKKTFP